MKRKVKSFDRKLLGQRVRLIREKMKLTQDELAKAVNRSRVSIVNLESGKTGPSLDLLLDIIGVSKESISVDYLLGLSDNQSYYIAHNDLKVKYDLLHKEFETCQKISGLQEELLKRK